MELDRIEIKDLLLRCIIGINDDEREKRQDVVINIVMHADLSRACASDDIADTVDYKKIKTAVIAMVEKSAFFLVERMAGAVADICLKDERVMQVDVRVDKPGALRFAKSVGITISRSRDGARTDV